MKLTNTILLSLVIYSIQFSSFAKEGATHFPGVFAGIVHTDEETEFTFGLEYEYKFAKSWGVGVIVEDSREFHYGDGLTVGLANVFYHPNSALRFGLGIGKERLGGAHPHSETIYRLSSSYEFHLDDIALAPTFAIDFVGDEHAYVIGIALIKPF